MGQTKNTFVQSKMNQDLDSRLIPNGQYRNAVNIAVSQAEGADVGTLQNVLGNSKITDFGLTENCNVNVIGFLVDDQNKDIYFFFTNFIDTSVSKLTNYPSDEAICQIWKRNMITNENVKLVEGKFLNFSLTHPITGINLLEDLLFWTDNRNQPRKINVNKANPAKLTIPSYYTNDDQINVAKYYPYDPIQLIKNYIVDYNITNVGLGDNYFDYIGQIVPTTGGSGEGLTVRITSATSGPGAQLTGIEIVDQGNGYENGDIIDISPRIGSAQITIIVQSASTMKDTCTERQPFSATFSGSTKSLTKSAAFDLLGGGWSQNDGPDYTSWGDNFIGSLVKITSSTDISPYLARVIGVDEAAGEVFINWPNGGLGQVINNVTEVVLGINPDYDSRWPGDCQYLKERFVRFAYRFKFTDNEYSLISPFTQACFIPKQDGYFLSKKEDLKFSGTNKTILDTEQAYDNTDNQVMINKVTNVELLIPAPNYLDSNVSGFSNIENQLHVKAIEIIYKDDNEANLRVLDTILPADFVTINDNFLYYNYQSRSPKRTLPQSEITRVSDRVPLKAHSQEVAGNRVIYGNYVDGFTSNDFLNYELAATQKQIDGELKKEYQNHTLKQNRSYQTGIVLSDRYGRQSDVILSSVDLESTPSSGVTYSGSTVFHAFKSIGFSSNDLVSSANTTWPGDVLRVKFNSQIPENIGKLGYPGLFRGYNPPPYSNLYGGRNYTAPGATNVNTTTDGSGVGMTVDYTTFASAGQSYVNNVIINNPGTGYIDGDIIYINDPLIPAPSIGTDYASFIYRTNLTTNLSGWHSYKIVVKQQEQDYYNVYLPGIVNGAINKDGVESATEATISLFGDNINKVPKDLTNVGPSQTNFNSNEILSLRVQNTNDFASVQFYPDTQTERVTQISELSDLGISLERISAVVDGGAVTGTVFPLTTFNEEKVFAGMSVTSVTSTGATRIVPSDGIYIVAYYATGGGASEVVFNKSLTVPAEIDTGDILTFGPPGIIYNSGNNPLIGIISTSEQIGVPEEDEFTTQLAVMETKPTESLLNIFYETTSAGRVDLLNEAIIEGSDSDVPTSISPIAITLDETTTGVSTISNNFYILDSGNLPIIDINATGSLVSVIDGDQNDVTSLFRLVDLSNGFFNISTLRSPGEGWYVGVNENLTKFEFTVSLESDGYTLFKSIDGEIGNIKPSYLGAYDGMNFNLTKDPVVMFPTSVSDPIDYFEGTNGSADVTLERKEIRWTLTSAILIEGVNASTGWYVDENEVAANFPDGVVQPSQTPLPFQYVINGDYSGLFTLVDWNINSNQSLNSIVAEKMRFIFAGIDAINNGARYEYVEKPLEGWQSSAFGWNGVFGGTPIYGDAVNSSVAPSFLVKSLKFELTFEAEDASGGPSALAADPVKITVSVE